MKKKEPKHNYYLTHFNVKPPLAGSVRPDLWAQALAYLKATNDGDGFRTLLYGA